MSSEPDAGGAAGSSLAVLLTLVPNSGIQFVDFETTVETAAHTRRRFLEEAGEGGEPSLHLAANDGGVFYHPVTNQPCDPAHTYLVDGVAALAPFLGAWLPVPFMRVSKLDDGDELVLDEGPSNWTRVHITRTGEGADARFRIVLAVDTGIEEAAARTSRGYVAPTLEDLKSGGAFRFSDDVNDVAWFVSEAWVDDWIKGAFDNQRGPGASATSAASSLQHLARYLTLLAVLKEACEFPAIRFMAPNAIGAYAETVPVDLALDLGTCRTAALLEERHPVRRNEVPVASSQTAIRGLPLRNLTEPWRQSKAVFSSRLVFARASFGSEALSRWSGRTHAFPWPSPVRTGPEADSLGTADEGADTVTGVSSPMHYVWDERPSRHVWRFASGVSSGGARGSAVVSETSRRNPVVSGTILAHLTESGDFQEERAGQAATTKPRFSRSSLVTLQVSEILLQAVAAINAPHTRQAGLRPDTARRLDRLLVTPPAGMSEAETAILRRRVEAAVKLVWQTMGWSREAHPLAPPPPSVVVTVDAATCTQLAYLENEIAHKFRGKAESLFALVGKGRAGFQGARPLRIATLDIGAATTGLSVATFETTPGNGVAATRQLVDGFEIGCDSVVKALAERSVLTALERRLEECKHGDSRRFLTSLLGANDRGRPAWVGDLGRRLTAELLSPAATAILRLYAHSDADAGDAPSEFTIATLLASVGADAKVVADRLDIAAADDGADGFSPLEVAVPTLMRDVGRIARDVLRPMLDSVVRVLAALDCDIVLLSGRGAELPVVREALMSGMPLRPDRIIAMHEHRFGLWYPTTSQSSARSDCKLLPAVGALLQARSAFGSGGPDIVLRPFDRAALGGFVGRLDSTGRISSEDVLFEITGAGETGRSRAVALHLPALIGLRSPSISAWPARAMWIIERAPAAGGRPPKMPVRVVLELKAADRGRPAALQLVSAVDGDGGRIDTDDLVLRLQCRTFAAGHWLDTGHLLADSTGIDA